MLGFILRKIIHPLNAHSDRNFAKIRIGGDRRKKNVAVVVMRATVWKLFVDCFCFIEWVTDCRFEIIFLNAATMVFIWNP